MHTTRYREVDQVDFAATVAAAAGQQFQFPWGTAGYVSVSHFDAIGVEIGYQEFTVRPSGEFEDVRFWIRKDTPPAA